MPKLNVMEFKCLCITWSWCKVLANWTEEVTFMVVTSDIFFLSFLTIFTFQATSRNITIAVKKMCRLLSFFFLALRLWRRATRAARQGSPCQERLAGNERAPTAANVTVSNQSHQPVCLDAAAAAARHGGKSQHDGQPGRHGQCRWVGAVVLCSSGH